MVKRFCGFFAFVILCALISGTGVSAQEDISAKTVTGGKFEAKEGIISNVLIVLDSSGSMSKKTRDGKQKLAAAKDALEELVDSFPAGLNTGMIVYGHRYKADCRDIQLVNSPDPINQSIKTDMKRGIKDLEPLGVTPIAASLELAGETLKDLEGENSIILISDGKETCGGDPVKVARDLSEKYGIKVYIDVIGFDVNKPERKQLEAIATAGGGRYYSADSARELKIATRKVAEERKVIKAPRKIVVPPPPPVPRIIVPEPPEIEVPPPIEEEKTEFLQRGKIERGGKDARGGKYYDDAVEIAPGEWRLDHRLQRNEYDYFTIKVKNGQRLNCSVRTTEVSSYGGIAIHSTERTSIVGTTAIGNNIKKEISYEVFDAPQDEVTVYIVVGTEYNVMDENVICNIWLEDHFDADSSTDAGNYYDTALAIAPGEYKNNWAPFGDIDMYKLELVSGQELSVRVIPDMAPRYFYLDLINEDREALAQARSKEEGSVAKAAVRNEAETQEIYIKVHHGGRGTDRSEGKYILKVDVAKPEE